MSSELALKFIEMFLAMALFFQTLEYLTLEKVFSETGIWRWSDLKNSHPELSPFHFFLSEKNFACLLWLRLIATLLMFFIASSFPVLLFLFLSTLLISVRFRGTFNGGSDYMTIILLSGLAISSAFHSHRINKGVIWYIAIQATLSYFLAGLAKIKKSEWRNGRAVSLILKSPNYAPPLDAQELFQNKGLAFLASWGVLLFELSFPLIFFVHSPWIWGWLATGLCFHLINAYFFGLNRFLIVWMATYPALIATKSL